MKSTVAGLHEAFVPFFLLMSIRAGEGRAGAQVRALSFDHLIAGMLPRIVLVNGN